MFLPPLTIFSHFLFSFFNVFALVHYFEIFRLVCLDVFNKNSYHFFTSSVVVCASRNLFIFKMVKLTEREKIEILCMIGYGDRARTQQAVADLFNEMHPDHPPICQAVVSRVEKKYREFGHVRDLPKPGRPSLDENERLNVLLSVEENPHVSMSQIATNFDVPRSVVHRLVRKHKFHPYKVIPVQELFEDDFDRRNEFCEQMQNLCNRDYNLVKNIIFSDEATFCLNGTVNRQNCRYWAIENPHWMMESHSQHPQKLNVWCGIVKERVIGPYFFDGTLNGERYLEFLRFELIPALVALFPSHLDPDSFDEELVFQQDGAPAHYAARVRAYLNETFPNRWIGRRGHIEWPARSPDLTPLDFFLWGYLKSKVYVNRPDNLDTLKERIRREVRAITPEIIRNVQGEFIDRLGYCQVQNGAHFEHLI